MNYQETYTWKEIKETPKIFERALIANESVMKELVSEIRKSKITNFVAAARGASNHAVIYFKYLLELMSNYTVGLSAPSIVTIYKGKINYANSIVIGCSQSGLAEDVLEVIKKGNEQGAITVALTNNPDSPIAKESKYHLCLMAGEKKSSVATKTFSSELFILLWLASELSKNKDNLFYLKHLKAEINHIIPEIDALTTKYLDGFKDINHGFVLSRGLTYAVALETSLLLQETCYIHMSGYASSEFYHGPLAMANETSPVIIYCAKNDGEEDVQSMLRAEQIKCIEKMLSLKVPVLLVTNDSILIGKFRKCKDAFLNFGLKEEFAIFAFALFAQMFACKISCLKGNNPDTPRALDNITITR